MATVYGPMFPVTITYQVEVIPPHCRKIRIEERTETIEVAVCEANRSDLKLAFGVNGGCDEIKMIFTYSGLLFTPYSENGKELSRKAFEERILNKEYHHRQCGSGKGREDLFHYAQEDVSKYLLVDDMVYIKIEEPVYKVQTFGFYGCGTGLFVEFPHEENPDLFFNALQADEAIAYAEKVAMSRGDDRDVGRFYPKIKVYMPELVEQPKHTEFVKMTTDDFMRYVQENFNVSGEALRLINNIVCYAQNSDLYGEEREKFLKDMLDNAIGIEPEFIHRVKFVREEEKQA